MSESEDAIVYVLETAEEIDGQNALVLENPVANLVGNDVPPQVSLAGAPKQEPVEAFSSKFLAYFEPDLKKINEKLSEVQQNQNVLIESLSQEKEKLGKCAAVNEVEAAMAEINQYRIKLCRIKKAMIALKEHSTRYQFMLYFCDILFNFFFWCFSGSLAMTRGIQ